MNRLMAWAVAAAILIAPVMAFAQGAPPPPSPAAGGATEPTMPSLDLENRPDGYTYKPEGRRDPFMNLQKSIASRQDTIRPVGVAGFSINEVHLRGIVKDSVQGFIALLLGPDGKTWFCKIGQRLYNGSITSIDAATVTFREEVTDPLSPVKTREVKKTLYPSEEARQ
jgi:Tfp pilus assembly protein PilP